MNDDDGGLDQLATMLWELGAAGALGAVVEGLLARGRVHHALALLRALSDPEELELLRRLATARLDSLHGSAPPPLPWVLEALAEDVSAPWTDGGAPTRLEAIRAEVASSGRMLRSGADATFREAVRACGEPQLDGSSIPASPRAGWSGRPTGLLSVTSFRSMAPLVEIHRHNSSRARGEQGTIDVALAFDAAAAMHAQIAIDSVRRTTAHDVTFHLVTREIDQATIADLSARQQIEVVNYDVSRLTYGEAEPLSHIASSSTFDRLLLPTLLEGVERVVYIDADVLVLDDLSTLADTDLGGRLVAARQILHGDRTVGQMLNRRRQALPPDTAEALTRWVAARRTDLEATLFNAGVLVLDLVALRHDRAFDRLSDPMSRFRLDDQDALCIHLAGRTAPLPRAWNHLVSFEYLPCPSVLHWVGPFKPWTHLGEPLADQWWRAARDAVLGGRTSWPIRPFGAATGRPLA